MAIFAVASSLLLSPLFLFLVVYCSVSSPSVAHFDANEWSEKRYGICELPLKFGNCTEKLLRFYYDTTKRRCFKFLYTGCNGNSNRFRTRNHCKRKCHPDFRMSAVFQSEQKKIAESERQWKECAQNCGKAGGKCVNGLCQCKSGYEKRDGKCIDSNECDWISCERNAKCVNLPGSFRCECRRNFAGSGFNCTKIRSICAQPFDVRYEHQCQPEQRWVPRFYFDFASAQCRHFWYGGCQFGSSQNFFQDKKNCESICGGYSQAEHFLDIAHSPAANAHQNIIHQQNNLQDPCLDPFDDTLRQHCAEGIWKRRYYFDAIMGHCRVFWMDMSCPTPRAGGSRSRNIFVHVQNCRRACEGKKENGREVETAQQQGELRRWPEWEEAWNTGGTRTAGFIQASFARSTPTTTSSTSTTEAASSTFAQMPELANECALVRLSDHLALSKTAQERRLRLSRLKAKFGKTQRNNEKEWSQQQQSHRSTNKKDGQSEACLDPFDWNLAKSCGGSRWRTRFFYDAHDAKCRPFWNDGCTGQTRNNFREKETCRRKCEQSEAEQQWDKQKTIWASAQEVRAMVEETPPLLSSSAICAQPFDDIYRHGCNNGKSWTRKWYFDATNGFCRHFWYDGCVGKSRNIFEGLKQCMDMCVNDKDFILMRRHSMRMENQAKYAYFGSAQSTVLRPHKNYLKSAEIWLNGKQCAGFRYNMSGNALLSAFLCLLEEGGSCQRTVHRATNGSEKCHFARSWLKGRHSYAWFFTMEKRRRVSPTDELSSIAPNESSTTTKVPPSSIDADHLQKEFPKTTAPTDKAELLELVEQRIEWTASAVLTLHQPQLNSTESLVVPIDLFGRHNETVATVELFIAPIEQCNGDTKC